MLSDIADLPAIKLSDTESLQFDLKDMTDFGREVAEKELRETAEVKTKAIEELRALLKGIALSDLYILVKTTKNLL